MFVVGLGNKSNASGKLNGPNRGFHLRSEGEGEGEYSEDDGDDEDEDDSILDAFDHLGDVISRTGSVNGLAGSLNLPPSIHTGGAAATTSNSLNERASYGPLASGSVNNQPVGSKSVDGPTAFAVPSGSSSSNNTNQHHSFLPPPHGAVLAGTVHTSGISPHLTLTLINLRPTLTSPKSNSILTRLRLYRYAHTDLILATNLILPKNEPHLIFS